MAVAQGMYRFTLSLIHCSVVAKNLLSFVAVWLWTSVTYVVKHKGHKLEAIQEDVKSLDKVPLHLAVIVNEDRNDICLEELARLVVWALASGVTTVTLYHPNDVLNDHFVSLRKQIIAHHQLMFSPSFPNLEVTSARELPQGKQDNTTHSDGHTVLVLSSEHGRQRLVNVACDLSTSVIERHLRLEDLNSDLIGNRISFKSDFSDPDLALVCGDTSCTLGYPPWTLRLTEIQSLPSHRKVTYQDFLGSLRRFSSCHQRFGK